MKTILVLYILSTGVAVSPTNETVYDSLNLCRIALENMRINVGDSGDHGWTVVAYCRPELTDD